SAKPIRLVWAGSCLAFARADTFGKRATELIRITHGHGSCPVTTLVRLNDSEIHHAFSSCAARLEQVGDTLEAQTTISSTMRPLFKAPSVKLGKFIKQPVGFHRLVRNAVSVWCVEMDGEHPHRQFAGI